MFEFEGFKDIVARVTKLDVKKGDTIILKVDSKELTPLGWVDFASKIKKQLTKKIHVMVIDRSMNVEIIPKHLARAITIKFDKSKLQDSQDEDKIKEKLSEDIGLPVILLDKDETIESYGKKHLQEIIELAKDDNEL